MAMRSALTKLASCGRAAGGAGVCRVHCNAMSGPGAAGAQHPLGGPAMCRRVSKASGRAAPTCGVLISSWLTVGRKGCASSRVQGRSAAPG